MASVITSDRIAEICDLGSELVVTDSGIMGVHVAESNQMIVLAKLPTYRVSKFLIYFWISWLSESVAVAILAVPRSPVCSKDESIWPISVASLDRSWNYKQPRAEYHVNHRAKFRSRSGKPETRLILIDYDCRCPVLKNSRMFQPRSENFLPYLIPLQFTSVRI